MVSAFKEFATQMKRQQHPRGDDLLEWQGSRSGVDVQRENREPHGVDRCEGDGPGAHRTQDTGPEQDWGVCLSPVETRRTAHSRGSMNIC